MLKNAEDAFCGDLSRFRPGSLSRKQGPPRPVEIRGALAMYLCFMTQFSSLFIRLLRRPPHGVCSYEETSDQGSITVRFHSSGTSHIWAIPDLSPTCRLCLQFLSLVEHEFTTHCPQSCVRCAALWPGQCGMQVSPNRARGWEDVVGHNRKRRRGSLIPDHNSGAV